MDEREADERYTRLVADVAQTRDLLVRVDERHWAARMDDVHRELVAHDARGLSRLLGAFGGMGSLNDLLIHSRNGHAVAEADVAAVNDELRRLASTTYADAGALKHDLDRTR